MQLTNAHSVGKRSFKPCLLIGTFEYLKKNSQFEDYITEFGIKKKVKYNCLTFKTIVLKKKKAILYSTGHSYCQDKFLVDTPATNSICH